MHVASPTTRRHILYHEGVGETPSVSYIGADDETKASLAIPEGDTALYPGDCTIGSTRRTRASGTKSSGGQRLGWMPNYDAMVAKWDAIIAQAAIDDKARASKF